MKMSQGFSRLVPSLLTVVGMLASFGFLALALKKLPLSVAYAVWTGIGTLGTVLAGIFFFRETVSLPHLICVALILTGIIGLRFLR